MSNIIVTGVDGSETAAAAALTAARLAAALDAELLVVSAYDRAEVEHTEIDGVDYAFTSEESAALVAKQAIEPLLERYPSLRATPVAELGKPAPALVEVAGRAEAELIVVGNKRVQGASRLLAASARPSCHRGCPARSSAPRGKCAWR